MMHEHPSQDRSRCNLVYCSPVMAIKIERVEIPDGIVALTIAPIPPESAAFEIDLLDSEGVEVALKTELDQGSKKLLIDLNRINYIHSRAFWAIVRAAEQTVTQGGATVVVSPSAYLARLVELTSAAEALRLFPSLDEGTRALQEDPSKARKR